MNHKILNTFLFSRPLFSKISKFEIDVYIVSKLEFYLEMAIVISVGPPCYLMYPGPNRQLVISLVSNMVVVK